jgi:hypothetical protein
MKYASIAPAALTALALLCGCHGSKPAATAPSQKSQTVTDAGSPRETVREALRDPDLANCRSAVAQMNTLFGRQPELRPPALSDAERDLLRRELNLQDDELEEAGRPEFTTLDAHYLEECLLFRDAARAIDPGSVGADVRAGLALAWVARQVSRLDEPPGQATLAAPPVYALKRGRGTTQERAYIFQALLRQMGLANCLFVRSEQPSGPRQIWAVGVLGESGAVLMFDPQRGRPLPGPDGRGVATLAQLRANPDLVKPLQGEPKEPWTVPPEVLKTAEPLLTPPLSSLAPRLRKLQELLGDENPVRLAIDPTALRDEFRKALQAEHLPPESARLDNPARDRFAPTRLLRSFLGPEEGGTDHSTPRLLEQFRSLLVPWDRLPPLLNGQELPGAAGDAFRNRFAGRFIAFYLDPREPREALLRGRYDDAVPKLVERLEEGKATLARAAAEQNLEQDAAAWCRDVKPLEIQMLRNRRLEAEGKPVEEPADLRARIESLVKNAHKVELLEDRAAYQVYLPEVTFQLALCKHEQAERLQAQLDHPAGARPPSAASVHDAWRSAEEWWTEYQRRGVGEQPFRADQAAALLARARKLATP